MVLKKRISMMKLTKSIDMQYLLKKAERGRFEPLKLRTTVAITNMKSGIRAREYAQSIIRDKSELSVPGEPFRNQTGRASRHTTSYANANKITLTGGTEYYKYLEFGTETRASHPVLRPAIRENMDYIINSLETEITKFYLKR
jgi:HK97 gp10 family phage protein